LNARSPTRSGASRAEPDDDDAAGLCHQAESGVGDLGDPGRLEDDLGSFLPRPLARCGDHVRAVLEGEELRACCPSALEPAQLAIEQKDGGPTVDGCRCNRLADRACPEDHDLLPRRDAAAHDRADGDGDRLDERGDRRVLVADGKDLRCRQAEPLLERAVAMDSDEADVRARIRAPDPAGVALPARPQRPDRDSLAHLEMRRRIRAERLQDSSSLVSLDARVEPRVVDGAEIP
jgi:hypothetical protein